MSDTELTVSHLLCIKVGVTGLDFNGVVEAMVWDRLPAGRKVIRRAALPTRPAASFWDRPCELWNDGLGGSNLIGGSIEASKRGGFGFPGAKWPSGEPAFGISSRAGHTIWPIICWDFARMYFECWMGMLTRGRRSGRVSLVYAEGDSTEAQKRSTVSRPS